MNMPERNIELVEKEHNQAAYELGIKTYQVKCLNAEIEKIQSIMLNLNQEGAKLMKEKANEQSNNANPTQGSSQESSPAAPSPSPEAEASAQAVQS